MNLIQDKYYLNSYKKITQLIYYWWILISNVQNIHIDYKRSVSTNPGYFVSHVSIRDVSKIGKFYLPIEI